MLMMLAQEAHAFALGLLGFTFRSAESGEIHDQSIHPPQLIEMAPGPDPNSVGDGAKRDEATTKVPSKDPKKKDDKKKEDLSEEDLQLKQNLELYVERVQDPNPELHKVSLESMRQEIRASTSSMTSVPKPLKFLRPHYGTLKEFHKNLVESKESLGYRLTGSEGDIGSWGHEYVRNLAGEIAEEYTVRQVRKQLFMSSLCLAFLCRMSLTYLDITDCYMLDRMPKRLGASVRTLGKNIGAKDTASRRLPENFNLDEATVKEMRKQEEIAKAKLAMERKKKLAEKAAAKAAIRAQKEAEKKEQKEREKAAKKKTGGSNAYEAISEEVPEASEAEKEEIEAPVEEKPKKEKKVLKEKPIRNRIRYRGGPETLPRPMLKRKKQTNYVVWAAPAAVVVLMPLDLGYYYVL
ncbi:BnaCnng48550D [Brassica napus]|uniref:BnaCnng48550D protein n=1 Tax=Brassica napus TaxID=3708 RepID=A0A078JIY2_BRANA|nr:BnaCnng48550D [Brassica napus]